MLNNKVWIKRGLFVVLVLIMLLKLIQLTFNESVMITETPVKSFEVSQEDIISSGKEITIKSFDTIEDVKWLSNDQLLIVGEIDNNKNQYLFDMSNYELMLYQENEHAPVDYSEYHIIREIPNKGLLATKGTAIGLLIDGDFSPIMEDISFENKLKYDLADDLSKLILYHAKKNTIVTYNFEKKFYRTIEMPIDDQLLTFYEDRLQLSPVGGYVSVEYRNELIEESYFRIYGADSGRLYAEDVYGVNLSWAPDDTRVCYYYSKELLELENPIFGNMDFVGRRIGYYDVESKEIDYIDTLSSEYNLISDIYWSDHMMTTVTGQINDTITLESLLSYDFDQETYSDWNLSIDLMDKETSIELLNDVGSYILLLESQDNHQVMRIMKDTQEVINYGEIKAFNTIDEENLYYYKTGDKFITTDVTTITVSNGNSQGYIQVEDQYYYILPNYSMSQIGVWFTNSNTIKILNTN
jgi:hypothetical protein